MRDAAFHAFMQLRGFQVGDCVRVAYPRSDLTNMWEAREGRICSTLDVGYLVELDPPRCSTRLHVYADELELLYE